MAQQLILVAWKQYNDMTKLGMNICHLLKDHSKWKQTKEEKKHYTPPKIDKPEVATATGPSSQSLGSSVSWNSSQPASSTPGMLKLNLELNQVITSFGLLDHDVELVWNLAYSCA